MINLLKKILTFLIEHAKKKPVEWGVSEKRTNNHIAEKILHKMNFENNILNKESFINTTNDIRKKINKE